MSELDALAEWLGEHGYLVMTTFRTYARGETLVPLCDFAKAGSTSMIQPFVIVAESTKQEYDEQCEWVRDRIGSTERIVGRDYYYRITTD